MAEVTKSKKTRSGIVVSTKMDKTVVVLTERILRHKLYGKFMRLHVKYLADDPNNSCELGDRILIEECRPLSKRKRWRVREIVEKAV
jgi:small subunit ribosomal protein S17